MEPGYPDFSENPVAAARLSPPSVGVASAAGGAIAAPNGPSSRRRRRHPKASNPPASNAPAPTSSGLPSNPSSSAFPGRPLPSAAAGVGVLAITGVLLATSVPPLGRTEDEASPLASAAAVNVEVAIARASLLPSGLGVPGRATPSGFPAVPGVPALATVWDVGSDFDDPASVFLGTNAVDTGVWSALLSAPFGPEATLATCAFGVSAAWSGPLRPASSDCPDWTLADLGPLWRRFVAASATRVALRAGDERTGSAPPAPGARDTWDGADVDGVETVRVAG